MLDSKRYKRILKVQKTIKIINELNLQNHQTAKTTLDNKKRDLLDLQNNSANEKTIWLNWIPQSLKHIYSQEQVLKVSIEQQQTEVLKSKKQIELTTKNYNKIYAKEQEHKTNLELAEQLNSRLSKNTK